MTSMDYFLMGFVPWITGVVIMTKVFHWHWYAKANPVLKWHNDSGGNHETEWTSTEAAWLVFAASLIWPGMAAGALTGGAFAGAKAVIEWHPVGKRVESRRLAAV